MSIDYEAVGAFLAQSRAAHSAYQQAKQNKKPVEARAQLQIAADGRLSAHEADPAHTAPAWAEDAIPGDHATATHAELHDQLTAFYAQQLAR